jgi:dolichyl-phosphate beta-glucosyltransferase
VGTVQKTIIVVPCYNECERLKEKEFILLSRRSNLQLLFVNDGSEDRTDQRLKEIAGGLGEKADILNFKRNRGKAEAVRQGMLHAIKEGAAITGYIDADMATPAKEVLLLLDAAMGKGYAVTLGSRVKLLGTSINRRPMRHYIGRVFATMASVILQLPVYDTQCGAKFFQVSPTICNALSEPFISRWIFDVELIGRLLTGSDVSKPFTEDDFIEIPLHEWRDVKGSKISFIDFAKVAKDLVCVALDLKARRQKKTGNDTI